MSMQEEQIIVEEEVQENGELQHGQNNFSRKLGNVLRRSKRLMSGRRGSKRMNKGDCLDKENIAPSKNTTIIRGNEDEGIGVLDSSYNGEIERSPKQRKASQTFFSSEKQIEIDGRKIKEIEVTGEKSPEPIDMKKQKKLVRKKSIDQVGLTVPCRDLGKADFEGWLLKKSGGHGLVPVSWKRYWCVMKSGKFYCYKTSFDIAADYLLIVKNYTVENAAEKKKIAFRMKPVDEDHKQGVFAGDTEGEVSNWMEIINKVLSGIDISQNDDNAVPDYEARKRIFSSATKVREEHHGKKRASTSAFQIETETTGMPAGFGARTSSLSQPRVRKMSAGGIKPDSALAVGSMFKPLEDPEEAGTPTKEIVDLKDLLYKQVEITPSNTPDAERRKQADLEKLNAEIAKLNSDMLVLNPQGERKVNSEEPAEPVKKFTMPTVEIEVEEPPKIEIHRDEKDMVTEEIVQLEIKDDSGKEKKTTSQLFNNLEEITSPKRPEDTSESEEVKVAEPHGEENKVEDRIPKEEPSQPTPPVEQEVKDSAEPVEIDAETVINELEEQTKIEEAAKAVEEEAAQPSQNGSPEESEETREEHEEYGPADAAEVDVNEESMIVTSTETVQVISTEPVADDTQSEETEAKEKQEVAEDTPAEEVREEKCAEKIEEDAPKEDRSLEDTKSTEETKTDKTDEMPTVTEETENEKAVSEEESKEEVVPASVEEETPATTEEPQSQIEEELKTEPTTTTAVPAVSEDQKDEKPESEEQTVDVDVSAEETKTVDTPVSAEETKTEDMPLSVEQINADTPVSAEETKTEDMSFSVEQINAEVPTTDEEIKDDKPSTEYIIPVSTEEPTSEEKSAGEETKEEQISNSDTVVKDDDKPAPDVEVNTEVTPGDAVVSDEADGSAQEKDTTSEVVDEKTTEAVNEETTETNIAHPTEVDDNSSDDRVNAEELTVKEKTYSLNLGDDLDIPSLDFGGSSLSDDINFELHLNEQTNTESSLSDNKEPNTSTQPNGDVNHIAMV